MGEVIHYLEGIMILMHTLDLQIFQIRQPLPQGASLISIIKQVANHFKVLIISFIKSSYNLMKLYKRKKS